MEAIGGYFELELKKGKHYHENAIRLNTARNCLEYILRAKKYTKIYIPYYTCDVILEPLNLLSISYEFYHINELLEPVNDVIIKSNEVYLYTNYYGIKQEAVIRLAKLYKQQLIVDNAQAFFAPPLEGIDTFYSARKFFGVADGAYLYTNKTIEVLEQDVSYERMSHLIKRIDLGARDGYADFQRNDQSLIRQPIKRMSKLTEAILSNIDYELAKNQRLQNYEYLNKHLDNTNEFHFSLGNSDTPMVYLYLAKDQLLKDIMIKNNVFVATYWPNVVQWANPDDLEHYLTTNLLSIIIDQRYCENEMKLILNYML